MSVTGEKYAHEVLFNRLGDLSLPRKSVVRLTDHPDMTLDVYRGRKTTTTTVLFCRSVECIRIIHGIGSEVWTEKSITRITIWHHESCSVMLNCELYRGKKTYNAQKASIEVFYKGISQSKLTQLNNIQLGIS